MKTPQQDLGLSSDLANQPTNSHETYWTPTPTADPVYPVGPDEKTPLSDQGTVKRIVKFLRLMNTTEDDDALIAYATTRNWLDETGNPTDAGRQLVDGFAGSAHPRR
ncbi:MAG: hypothetical protein AAGA22_01545 [Pseudomonadota bacterium]